MDIREYRDYKAEDVLRLYASVGWTAYTDDPAALERGFRHSLLVLAAWEDGELAGLIRARRRRAIFRPCVAFMVKTTCSGTASNSSAASVRQA